MSRSGPDYLAPRLGLTPRRCATAFANGDVVGVTEAGEGADAGKTRIVLARSDPGMGGRDRRHGLRPARIRPRAVIEASATQGEKTCRSASRVGIWKVSAGDAGPV